jgi:hypothetical protein
MDIGAWLRDNWIPDNAEDIITALGDAFNTAVDGAVTTYLTEHAGDIIAALGGGVITVNAGDVITNILGDPGQLFCMDDAAHAGADATGNGTNSKHFRLDGHMHTDGLVLNPHSYLDPTKIFCTGDGPGDLTLAKLATGSDSTGMVMIDGHLFWDAAQSLYNVALYLDPTKIICVHEPNGDEITAGSKHIKGFNYWDDESKIYNPFVPFPDGDTEWIEVDAANGLIKHIGPGPSAFATTGSLALTGLDLDAKGHVRTVSYCTIAAGHTIGPCAP